MQPPLILPKQDPITRMLMEEAHQKCSHQGVGWTRYIFMKEYWCGQAEALARSVVWNCTLCKRMKKATLEQGMSNLPPWRLETNPRPFSYVGVDYAGPLWCYKTSHSEDRRRKFQAKEKDRKLYIILFTCMQIRAVHFELVDSQATEPLNRAVRRFMARKGKPSMFYSDNAKSFKKAASEVDMLQELHRARGVRNTLNSEGIRWQFMPERAPWWGGLHERMVKTMKQVLRVTLTGRFTEEEIHTFVVEAEGLINSRPLAVPRDDPGEPLPVTPSELLLGYNISASPFPSVATQGKETELKKMWSRRQHLLQLYRRRFTKDYIQNLQTFNRAQHYDDEPLQVGDLVLYEDGISKRADWPLGRVVELHPGRDGKIRSVTIKTARGETKRALQRLVQLERTEIKKSEAESALEEQNDASDAAESAENRGENASAPQREENDATAALDATEERASGNDQQ